MVVRNNRHGVRTGNTLKASNSRYLRVYSRHSAFVRYYTRGGMSDVKNENEDIDFVVNGNTQVWNKVHNNVVYSLNKKGRWNLPDQLQEFITDTDHTDDDVRLSLLKSSKLCRQANSFGYWSTSGETRKVKPKKFFHRNAVIDPLTECSTDAKEEEEKEKENKEEEKGKKKHSSSESKNIKNKTLPSDKEKGEVIYEVYYPVPIKCSIAHNPKYIQDQWAPNEVKKGKKHPSLNHTKTFGQIWEEEKEGEKDAEENGNSYSEVSEDSQDEENGDFLVAADTKSDKLVIHLEDLIQVVHKAKHLTEISPQDTPLVKATPKKYGKGETILIPKDFGSSSKPLPMVPIHKSSLEMVGTVIIMTSADVTFEALKEKFGPQFHQINCFPRKFLINITEELNRIPFPGQFRSANLHLDLSSYLIFTHQAVHDTNSDIYRVCLNMNLSKDTANFGIETLFKMNDYKIEEVVKAAVCFVETLPRDVFGERAKYLVKNSWLDLMNLQSQNKWNLKLKVSNIAYSSFLMEQMVENDLPSDFEIISSEPDFCDLCFEEIDPSKLESKSATALLQCSHWFCDDCWIQYLISEMTKKDKLAISCPQDNCTSVVDVGVCLSLVGLRDVLQFVHQQYKAPTMKTEVKWCPFPNCNRILCVTTDKIASGQTLRVICECGNELCFSCLQPFHWPASCLQNQLYQSKLKSQSKDDTFQKISALSKPANKVNYLSSANVQLPSSPKRIGRKRKSRGLYTFTIRHHNLQQKEHLGFLKRNAKKFTCRILNLVKSQGAAIVSELIPINEVSLEPDAMKNIQSQVTQFVNAIVNLIPKLHQVIEFTAVYLDGLSPKDLSPEQIKNIICKLEFITLQMTEILTKEKKSDLKKAIGNLLQLQIHSQRTMNALLKFL